MVIHDRVQNTAKKGFKECTWGKTLTNYNLWVISGPLLAHLKFFKWLEALERNKIPPWHMKIR